MIPAVSSEDRDLLITENQDLWPSLAGRKIFITGGTGFFGKWLMQALVAANEAFQLKMQISLLARRPSIVRSEQPWLRDVELIEGDVLNFTPPYTNFDFIIHAATSTSTQLSGETNETVANTVLDGTRQVLKLGNSKAPPRFLFVSSGAVYGEQPPAITHISESYGGAPQPMLESSVYGEAKRMAELYCQLAQKRGEIVLSVARCYAFVGPYLPLNTHFAAGNFIADVLAQRPIVLKGDGRPFRSYMYPTDLVHWLLTLLVKAEPGGTYNVGSDDDRCLKDIALMLNELRAEFGLQLSAEGVQVLGQADPNKPRLAYIPSVDAARRKLGLSLRIDTRTGFHKTIAWHRANADTLRGL